jgi:cobalt/nickel transport system permease protein
MHIPDGYLKLPVWAALDAVAIPAVAGVAARAQRNFQDNRVPLMGVMGAFIFAAQMINFPVGNGTSGHLVGGALLTFTLGPAAASIVMTAILAIQALVFQDGGVLALGANVFNMALAGVAAAWLPWTLLGGRRAGIFVGALLSLLVSALLALSELMLSGIPMPGPVLAVSLGLFLVTGVMEAAITLVVLQSIERIQPGLRRAPAPQGRTAVVLALAAASLVIVAAFVVVAIPDGVEKIIAAAGLPASSGMSFHSPMADYQFDSALKPWLSRSLAGLAGLGIIYIICLVLARMIAATRPAPGREGL